MFNIARKIYAAWNTSTIKQVLPEAEVAPVGTAANEKRKKESITKRYTTVSELDNIPLPGFTLFKVNRKNGWGTADMSWLVIDPRGFLVRISNQNLEEILFVTGITEGLIQERCVWARDDSQTKMTLVPVSSPKYIQAVENTALIEGRFSLTDIQIGDTVLLQNELKGIYRGVLSLYGPLNNYSSTDEYKPQGQLRKQVLEVSPGKYHYQSDLKILKILNKAAVPMTREDSAATLNKEIEAGSAFFTSGTNVNSKYYSIHGYIKFVSVNAVPKVHVTYEEINNYEATKLFYDALEMADVGMLAVSDATGNYVLDFPYMYASVKPTINNFQVSELKSPIAQSEKVVLKAGRKSYYGATKNTKTYRLDNFTKFYKIVKHVKGDTFI